MESIKDKFFKKIVDELDHPVLIIRQNGDIIYTNSLANNIADAKTSLLELLNSERHQQLLKILHSGKRKKAKFVLNQGSEHNKNHNLQLLDFHPVGDEKVILHIYPSQQNTVQEKTKIPHPAYNLPKNLSELDSYKMLIEDQVDLIIRWSSDYYLYYANQAFLEFFDITAEEVRNIYLLSFIHPDDQERVREKIQSLTPAEPIKIDERQVVTRDGSIQWQQWADRAFFSPDGRIIEIQSVGRDIDTLKQANLRIKESEERLQIALNAADMGLWDWNVKEDRLIYTENLKSVLGDQQEIKIGDFYNLIHDEDQEKVKKEIERIVDHPDEEFEVEFRFRLAGDKRWFANRGRVYQIKRGKPILMAGAILEITQKKLADQASRENEERYRSVVSAMKEGIVLYTSLGEITTCNQTAGEILGLKKDPKTGKFDATRLWESFHENGTPFSQETHPAILTLKTGIPQRDILMRIKRGKKNIWLSVNAQPIFTDNDITPSSVVVSFNDVTLQKSSQEALIEGEKRYRSLFESANDAILLIRRGKIIECNPKGLEYFRGTLQEIINVRHDHFFPQQQSDHSLSNKKFNDKIKNAAFQEQQSFKWTYKRLDGSLFDADISLTSYKLNNEKMLLAIIRDVTERNKYENEIRKLALVTRNIDNAVVVTDENGLIEWVNDGFTRITGYLFEEAVGKRPGTILHGPETDHKVIKKVWKDLIKGESVKAEIINYTKEGKKFWLEMNIQPILNEQNQLKQYISIQRDITPRKKQEEAINLQNTKLIKANQELDNFVYSVSHDLRAPITSALGLIEISRKSNDLEEIHNYLNLQKRSLTRMDKFIQDILNYSRNSRIDIQKDKINFSTLIEETLAQYSFIKGAQEITKITSIKQDQSFYSDQRRLSVVLSNLISNAIQFSNPFNETPCIKISVKVLKNETNIEIQDNGIGIEKSHIDKIFNMFYRATNYQPGSGLGLYIVKESIDKLKGKIAVESQLGVGTTFTIIIPNLKL